MRFRKLGTPALASILLLSLYFVGAGPALAQTGESQAYVYDYNTGTFTCSQYNTGIMSSATCAIPVTSGVASGTTAQDAGARTLSANATLDQTGSGMYAQSAGYSYQYNQFNVVGTSASTDHLLFHFLTNGPYATASGGVDYNSFGFGEVYLNTSTGTDYNYVYAYGNGITYSYSYGQSTAGTGFLDFTMPFGSYTGEYFYTWFGEGYTYATGQPIGLSLTGGFSGTLDAIYAENDQGQIYGSVDFSTGQLELTTVPEPATLALFATGLFGLVPMMRRKLRK